MPSCAKCLFYTSYRTLTRFWHVFGIPWLCCVTRWLDTSKTSFNKDQPQSRGTGFALVLNRFWTGIELALNWYRVWAVKPKWMVWVVRQRRLHIPGQGCLRNHQFFRVTGVQFSNLNFSRMVTKINELLSNHENLVPVPDDYHYDSRVLCNNQQAFLCVSRGNSILSKKK